MSELQAALLGVFIGGALGIASTAVASYFGPRKLEQWRAETKEKRDYGPRKDLLKQMLLERDDLPIRTLERLQLVTGTSEEECRRLLIQIDARGVRMKDGREGWALISRWGLNESPNVKDQPDDA